jgi:Methyltransferase domain
MPLSIHSIFRWITPVFRRRRMRRFRRAFEPTSATTILDVGGYPATWQMLAAKPYITVLNVHSIDYVPQPGDPPMEIVIGDGCNLGFSNQSFDIVFSNSVIEHLGTFDRQKAFASESLRVASRLWIQTPAKSFFIEPHLITPFIHFLPRSLQRKLMRNFTVWGLLTRPTAKQVDDFLAEIRLLSYHEMRELFPGCAIIRERFFGLTKSYISVKT